MVKFTVSRKPKLNQAPLSLPEVSVVPVTSNDKSLVPVTSRTEALPDQNDAQDRVPPLVSTTAIEKGKAIVREAGTGWDIYAIVEQFTAYVERKGRPENATGAFLGFVRKKVRNMP